MEINRVHIKTIKSIVEQEGVCPGISCRNCPFSRQAGSNTKLCGGNEFWHKRFTTETRTQRAERYLRECREELQKRFDTVQEHCRKEPDCNMCVIKKECDKLVGVCRSLKNTPATKVKEIIDTIMGDE